MASIRNLLPVLLLGTAACQTTHVRLYELREAPPGSPGAASYANLETAVELANAFLASPAGRGAFSDTGASFQLSHTDILITVKGDGVYPMRLEGAGWLDLRTVFQREHSRSYGVLVSADAWSGYERDNPNGRIGPARPAPPQTTWQELHEPADSKFLRGDPDTLAENLLRATANMLQVRERGSFGFHANDAFFAITPDVEGWAEENPVRVDGERIAAGFRAWRATGSAAPATTPAGSPEPGD